MSQARQIYQGITDVVDRILHDLCTLLSLTSSPCSGWAVILCVCTSAPLPLRMRHRTASLIHFRPRAVTKWRRPVLLPVLTGVQLACKYSLRSVHYSMSPFNEQTVVKFYIFPATYSYDFFYGFQITNPTLLMYYLFICGSDGQYSFRLFTLCTHDNFGVHAARRKAKDRDAWHQVVSTATLC